MSDNDINTDSSYNISKDEFMEFIEIKLWSKFLKRLWGIVGIFLTIITIAGIFGIPYYINNELKSRLTKLEADFDINRKEIINKTKLLTIAQIKQEEKKQELLYRTLIIKEGLEIVIDTLSSSTSQLNEVRRSLNTIFYEQKLYESQLWRFDIRDSTLREIELLPSQLRHQEIIGSGGYMTYSALSHPINDGTIGGLLDDLIIRLAHLNAMNGIIEELAEDLVVYDNETESEKLQNKILLDLSFKKKSFVLYDTLLYKNLEKHFDEDRIKKIIEYKDLYKVDLELENSLQQGVKMH